MAELSQCPGCDLELPEEDYAGQREHLVSNHLEIILERLAELDRTAGWVDD
jgi:hypothetical protein